MSEQVVEIMSNVNMKRIMNKAFLQKAKECAPVLAEEEVGPAAVVSVQEDGKIVPLCADLSSHPMKKGDSVCLDFGNHYVGYATLTFRSVGSHQDAPAYIRLKFGETAKEITENSDEYDGWISRGWIQEEFLHIDVLPARITLPRRYAFRYLEIRTIAASLKWELVLEDARVRAVSAVRGDEAAAVNSGDEIIDRIDRVGLRTLKNCMQSVFEDGPKRDRRLWIGDLRLQALANYETFQKNDLVKRCLYLFAGMTRDDGRVTACLYIEPEYMSDDVFFFDYSLFFAPCLYDYHMASGDMDTLKELWPCALRQIELAAKEFDEKNVYRPKEQEPHCFIDWKAGLDKQAAGQAIYIYCVKRAVEIAKLLGDANALCFLQKEAQDKAKAALDAFWDEERGLFVSGEDRQISYASQAWMVLAGVAKGETARRALLRVLELDPDMGMATPYMNHHFTEALFLCGEKEKAVEFMKYYWGGMVKKGADTFWELYNPKDPNESPYGSDMVNSYCHAWSCTPVYLIRKYCR